MSDTWEAAAEPAGATGGEDMDTGRLPGPVPGDTTRRSGCDVLVVHTAD